MSVYTTEALVLGVKNWGEADKIITFFSREHGRIQATAFGCRRPKSPLAGPLQLFNTVEVQLTKGERLDTVRQCSLKHSNRAMSSDFAIMAYGAFVAELATSLAVDNFPQGDMYDRLGEIFNAFGSRNPRIIALAAAYQLLEFSGMQLSYRYCIKSNQELEGDAWFSLEAGGAISQEAHSAADSDAIPYPEALRIFILHLLELDWKSRPSFTVSGRIMVQAESIMLSYLNSIFGKPLKSLQFIQQLG